MTLYKQLIALKQAEIAKPRKALSKYDTEPFVPDYLPKNQILSIRLNLTVESVEADRDSHG